MAMKVLIALVLAALAAVVTAEEAPEGLLCRFKTPDKKGYMAELKECYISINKESSSESNSGSGGADKNNAVDIKKDAEDIENAAEGDEDNDETEYDYEDDPFVQCIANIDGTVKEDGTYNDAMISTFTNAFTYENPEVEKQFEAALRDCSTSEETVNKIIACQFESGTSVCGCNKAKKEEE